ncbi:MAG: thrombospondin type 3 repeat-containing protein [Myxococcota bacterium]
MDKMSVQRIFAALLFVVASLALSAGCGGESNKAGVETDCTDRIDNDGDGQADCKDSDCATDPACQIEHCYNLVDDDGDGDVDCEDSDCEGTSVCSGLGEDCVNNRDDDGDGALDCDDSDCANTAACSPGAENCVDGEDNDGDGDVDCDDSDCAKTAVCTSRAEDCDDGEDNDGDGDVDCDDSDCARTSACLEGAEDCANAIDDDGDGRVDCLDLDCAYTAACLELTEDCENGIDDDGDGAVDCQDVECQGTSACVRLCTIDSDGDGRVDCDDPDVDGDGIDNTEDNCPTTPNPDQADECDGDGVGDACQDGDGDGINDDEDNCCAIPNPDQRNRDADANASEDPTALVGNACDPAETYAYAEWAIELPGGSGGINRSELPGGGGVLTTGDLDNDGLGDFVIGGASPEGPVVYFVPGSEALASTSDDPTYTVDADNILVRGGEFTYSTPVSDPHIGDFDGDSIDDLIFLRSGGEGVSSVEILYGPFSVTPEGVQVDERQVLLQTAGRPVSLDGADFSGDGLTDVLVGFEPGFGPDPGRYTAAIFEGRATRPAEGLALDDAAYEISVGSQTSLDEVRFIEDILSYQGNSGTPDVAIYLRDAFDYQGGLFLISGERIADDVANSPEGRSSIDNASLVYSSGEGAYIDGNFRITRDITADGRPELLMPGAVCSSADNPRGIFMTELRTNSSGLRLFENSEYRLGCDGSDIDYDWVDRWAVGDLNGDGRDELFLSDTQDPMRSAYYEMLDGPLNYSLQPPDRTFLAPGEVEEGSFGPPPLGQFGIAQDVNGDGLDDHFLVASPTSSELGLRPEPSMTTIYVFFWP